MLLARIADEVPDDQEIAGEPHLLDHLDLVLETTLVLVDRMTEVPPDGQLAQPRQPLRKPFARHVLEVAVDGEALGHAEGRQVVLSLRNRDVAALGNEQRVLQRVGDVLEDNAHLLGRLQEELIAVVAQALRIVDGLAGADAEQDVVRLMIALLQIVHVVRADERQVQLVRERQQASVDDRLFLDPLILHLEEEVVRPEDVAETAGRFERGTRLLDLQRARHLALEAAAEADEAFRVPREQLLVDARPVVKAFGIARRDELDQVLVALVRLREQHEVIRLGLRSRLVEAAPLRDVDLAAENRLQSAIARVVVEDDRRKQVAVLRHRERRHLQLDGFIQQLVDAARAIEEREFGV